MESFIVNMGLVLVAGSVTLWLIGAALVRVAALIETRRGLARSGSDGSPYRDARGARILALEAEQRALKQALVETNEKLNVATRELEETRRRQTTAPDPNGTSTRRSLGILCLTALSGFAFGAFPPASVYAPSASVDVPVTPGPPPTMIAPTGTSGGEIPVEEPPRVYVIVIVPSYRPMCHEAFLELEPTYAIIELANGFEWVEAVWIRLVIEWDEFGPPPSV